MQALSKTKIQICIPAYGQQVTVPTMASVFALTRQLNAEGVNCEITTLSDSLVLRSRNVLASDFLRSDASHLCFVDADSEFPQVAVTDMLRCNKEIIACCFGGKKFDWDRVLLGYTSGFPRRSYPRSQAAR